MNFTTTLKLVTALSRQKWLRLGLVGLTLVALTSAYLAFQAYRVALHGLARQFVIQLTLDRFPDAIVVLGDSIVELSKLPRSLCGHEIVNAGIGGSSTASDLGSVLAKSLKRQRAALIVVSLGTNDAWEERGKETFALSYSELVKHLSSLTAHVVVMATPPVEDHEAMNATINDYNSILPDIAQQTGAAFVSLPEMPTPHTAHDGVHLNPAGYVVWNKAVLKAAGSICDPNRWEVLQHD